MIALPGDSDLSRRDYHAQEICEACVDKGRCPHAQVFGTRENEDLCNCSQVEAKLECDVSARSQAWDFFGIVKRCVDLDSVRCRPTARRINAVLQFCVDVVFLRLQFPTETSMSRCS